MDRKRIVQRAAEIKTVLDARLERSEMLLHNLRDYLALSQEGRERVFQQWCYQNGLTINCRWILGITIATNRSTADLTYSLPPNPESWTEAEWKLLGPVVVANPIECHLSLRSSVTNGNRFLEDYDLRCTDAQHNDLKNPSPKRKLTSAIRGSRLSMSDRQPVMLDADRKPIVGTAFYVPIYRRELDPYLGGPVPEEVYRQWARWLHLSAVIVAPVDFNRLVAKEEAAAADLGLEIFSSIHQLTAETWMNADRPIPRATDPTFRASLTHRQTWPMYGDRYCLFFYTKPIFDAQSPRRLARIAGWSGLAITLLATALVGVSVRARNRQEGLTAQIREARDALAAAQRERVRISRDLHDGTIQSLYAIQLGLGHTAKRLGSEPAHAGSELFAVRRELDTVIAEIRQFITAETEENPRKAVDLCTVLQALSQRAAAGTQAKITLQCDPSAPARVSANQAVHLANIAREALSNAMRHGRPKEVRLSLQLEGDSVVLETTDDGVGFQTDAKGRGGVGLRSMTARAVESGGTLSIRSTLGQGTRVLVRLPLEPAEAPNDEAPEPGSTTGDRRS